MEAFSSAGFTKADFTRMTEESKLMFRKGSQHLLKLCQGCDIRFLIVSGGISELIQHSLRMLERHNLDQGEQSHDFTSVGILSNEFEYSNDSASTVSGYREPLIHSGNKQEVIYDHSGVDLRKNVIVMGDIVEDSQMVRDANHETVLRVGFLNRQVQEESD